MFTHKIRGQSGSHFCLAELNPVTIFRNTHTVLCAVTIHITIYPTFSRRYQPSSHALDTKHKYVITYKWLHKSRFRCTHAHYGIFITGTIASRIVSRIAWRTTSPHASHIASRVASRSVHRIAHRIVHRQSSIASCIATSPLGRRSLETIVCACVRVCVCAFVRVRICVCACVHICGWVPWTYFRSRLVVTPDLLGVGAMPSCVPLSLSPFPRLWIFRLYHVFSHSFQAVEDPHRAYTSNRSTPICQQVYSQHTWRTIIWHDVLFLTTLGKHMMTHDDILLFCSKTTTYSPQGFLNKCKPKQITLGKK